MKSIYSCLLAICAFVATKKANSQEISFSLQGNTLTWFEVNTPGTQGSLNITGVPGGFEGNSLAYDDVNQRLLFLNGPSSTSHALYSISVNGLSLTPGTNGNIAATSTGNLTFSSGQELYGAGFYGGYYYTLLNGTDTLVRVGFNAAGMVTSKTNIDLPGANEMYLGDIAFNSTGDMWISGYNQSGVDKLWRFHTNNGTSFTSLGAALDSPVDRYNGIFFANDVLYGYHLANSQYGIIDTTNGNMTTTFTGSPFNAGGDLTNGISLPVVPEPASLSLFGLSGAAAILLRRRASK